MRYRPLVLALTISGIAGCRGTVTGPEGLNGTYQYIALHNDDTMFHEGTLRLEFAKDYTITGRWNLNWGSGPGIGEGVVEGAFNIKGSFGNLTLDLDVGSAEQDFVVDGRFGHTVGGFTGTWTYTSSAGDLLNGRITAWR